MINSKEEKTCEIPVKKVDEKKKIKDQVKEINTLKKSLKEQELSLRASEKARKASDDKIDTIQKEIDEELDKRTAEDADLIEVVVHESIVRMLNERCNREFREMLLSSVDFLNSRRFMNYDKVSGELAKTRAHSVNIDDYRDEDTNISMYSRIINDIDATRSRISAIMSYAQADLYWVEKTYETLFKVWVGKFSKLSSDKKREGEADQVLFFLLTERIKRKELLETSKHKYSLMNAKMEAISRKITIASELMRHHPSLGNVYNTETGVNATPVKKESRPKSRKSEFIDKANGIGESGLEELW